MRLSAIYRLLLLAVVVVYPFYGSRPSNKWVIQVSCGCCGGSKNKDEKDGITDEVVNAWLSAGKKNSNSSARSTPSTPSSTPTTGQSQGNNANVTKVNLDIKNNKDSTSQYEYVKDKNAKTATYTCKQGYGFSSVGQKTTEIWKAPGSDYGNKVVVEGVGNNQKTVTIHFPNGSKKVFNKPGKNKPWNEIPQQQSVTTNQDGSTPTADGQGSTPPKPSTPTSGGSSTATPKTNQTEGAKAGANNVEAPKTGSQTPKTTPGQAATPTSRASTPAQGSTPSKAATPVQGTTQSGGAAQTFGESSASKPAAASNADGKSAVPAKPSGGSSSQSGGSTPSNANAKAATPVQTSTPNSGQGTPPKASAQSTPPKPATPTTPSTPSGAAKPGTPAKPSGGSSAQSGGQGTKK